MVKCGILERWNIRQLTKKEIKDRSISACDKKYNINELCEKVGITRQAYNLIINNKRRPSLEVALNIYNYLYDIGFTFLQFEDVFYIDNV